MIAVDPHPALVLGAFVTAWTGPLCTVAAPAWLDALCDPSHPTGLPGLDDEAKRRVRDLLRHGGFKPAGRSKPCSEYLWGAAARGAFPRINAAVDACNVAVLHGGLPVSCVDLWRIAAPLRVGIAEPGSRYVFNPSGQEIDVGGLLCLFDRDGPCANAVKDAQRAKTSAGTTETLSLVWGTSLLPGRTERVLAWYEALVARLGGQVRRVTP